MTEENGREDLKTQRRKEDARKKTGGGNFRRLAIFSAVAVLLAFISVFVFVKNYHLKSEQYQEKLAAIEAMEKDNQKLARENERLKQQVEYLQTKSGVESVAREKLGFVKPEEIAFVVVPSDAPAPGTSAHASRPLSDEPDRTAAVSGGPKPGPSASPVREDRRNWFIRFWDSLFGR